MVNYIKRVLKNNNQGESSPQSDTTMSSSNLAQLIELTRQAEADKQTTESEIIDRLIAGGLNLNDAKKLLNKYAASIAILSEFN